jgi:hypothetical protein
MNFSKGIALQGQLYPDYVWTDGATFSIGTTLGLEGKTQLTSVVPLC